MRQDLLWDGVCRSPVMGWALHPGQSHAVAHSGSHALLPSLTWSHPPLLMPVLHSFVTFPGYLSYLWLLCVRPGFGISGSAKHSCYPQPWQGAGTHPDSPAPWVSQHGCAAARGSAWAPPKETCREVTGCLGKQALALASHTRKIKTSGQAAA